MRHKRCKEKSFDSALSSNHQTLWSKRSRNSQILSKKLKAWFETNWKRNNQFKIQKSSKHYWIKMISRLSKARIVSLWAKEKLFNLWKILEQWETNFMKGIKRIKNWDRELKAWRINFLLQMMLINLLIRLQMRHLMQESSVGWRKRNDTERFIKLSR